MRDKNEHIFARRNGPRETAETAFAFRRPGPSRKKKRGIPAIGWRRKRANRGAVVAKQTRVDRTQWENVNYCTRRNGK